MTSIVPYSDKSTFRVPSIQIITVHTYGNPEKFDFRTVSTIQHQTIESRQQSAIELSLYVQLNVACNLQIETKRRSICLTGDRLIAGVV